MNQQLYDVYFSGQLIEGADIETAKASFAKMFKASPEAVALFFSGKPQPLKRGVDKAEALKYKAALHKAGMLASFKAHQSQDATLAPNAPTDTATAGTAPTATAPAEVDGNDGSKIVEDWSLAPTGSDLLKDSERHVVPARQVDTSAIKLVSAFASLEPEPKMTPPPPNTSHISVAAAGEDLLLEKPASPAPPPLDLDNITLAPPGAALEELKDEHAPVNPDISGITLAEPGAELLEGQVKVTPPPPPNTDHIKVADN